MNENKNVKKEKWFDISEVNWKNEVLAGLTVALALIPESIAFAFVAGVSPILSLQTAVMIGIIAALFTGRPGMISSSTAAISVVFASLIASHGLEHLFAAVIMMGLIQIGIGMLKLGTYARLIPYPVMLGFLNGLSIVIFLSQMDLFKVNTPSGKGWLPGMDLAIMLVLVAITMGIIHFLPRLTKAVPSSLAAIVIMTLVAVLLSRTGYHLQTVKDFAGMGIEGGLPSFHLPQVNLTLETLKIITPYAVIAALVGLTEAALTLRVIDEMTSTKGNTNQECVAQGLSNLVNGFFGGMGGDAMIGQSIINIKSGGRSRVSGLVAASALLFFIMFGSSLINIIPLAALVGVMFMVVVGTFEWESLRYGNKIPGEDIVVIVAVTAITVFVDLATAVLIGVILSSLVFSWKKGKGAFVESKKNTDGSKTYRVHGSIFFGSVLNIKDLFHPETDPDEVILDFEGAKVMDYSGIEAIDSIVEKYVLLGKKVTLIHLSDSSRRVFHDAKEITRVTIDAPVKG